MEAAKTSTPVENKEETSLKGTMVSVLFVLGVIVVMWVGVFWLYMSRV
ncbi:cytochrome c oxidase subunit 2A [Virgibacillus litoralis]|uniref:Cytochrome c oxidase subunit 2A n=1 Tax=Virgibacillus litoralis TaxID=578221 RepID=A0ABS4H8S0_9BACI|nr:cytochrome c oxidase subunit 2A [Virgibacillus litoralis]MBP1947295.1 hypothetical protein [Virgibacillus litoralis]